MTVVTARDTPSARVYLDGIDVSNICTSADPDEGWVDLLPNGEYKADGDGNVITARKYGNVQVNLPVRFTESDTVWQSRELQPREGQASPFVRLDA